MRTLRAWKGRELFTALRADGWALVRQRGSHRILRRGAQTYVFSWRDADELPPGLVRAVARRLGAACGTYNEVRLVDRRCGPPARHRKGLMNPRKCHDATSAS
jgi:predicted RNA binding protein YcfA (HicA-like mRNA interferase family)